MIKIRDARYVGRFPERLPRHPQCAFAGRSNVGKSSLINRLLNRKALVKTSKQPGKTRTVDFFEVDLVGRPPLYLVDLPGYGYARVSREMKTAWEQLLRTYLLGEKDIRLLLLLVDIRRDLKDEEHMILDLARASSMKVVLVATKADKVNTAQRRKRLK
ncbi:MAG: ribosome biogenesis GTP-binding protein YihA/YsxC, partial [Desulfomonilia bacterium]|nr:ribosome biogenesis GTP-binding protein YihA/YsxC [Desulfomonilia bacterium]